MYTQKEKPKENKSRSVLNVVSQMKSCGESTFQFVENRSEAVAQRKLQEIANNSPQVKQAAQLQDMANNYSARQQQSIQKKENNTRLADNLKAGIENLSGYSMDDVKVHRNSDKPAQLQAHAYAQGTDIHLGPGQEKHLPHEAWHVIQQKQGRVKPTVQMKGGVNVNDDAILEKEVDVMGAKSLQMGRTSQRSSLNTPSPQNGVTQAYKKVKDTITSWNGDWRLAEDDTMLVKDETKQAYATEENIRQGEDVLAGQNSAAKLTVGDELHQKNNPGTKSLFKIVAMQRTGDPLSIGQDCGNSCRQVMGIHGDRYYRAVSKPKGSLKETTTAARPYMGGKPDTTHLWSKEILLRAFNKVGVVPSASPPTAESLQKQLENLSDDERQAVIDESGINKNAVPELGQGIVISSLSMNTGEKWNFHFGTAIMKSGSDYTTLENDASQPNPQSWYFRLFGPASKEQSFYDESKATGDYGSTPIAMLLDPKDSVDRHNIVLKQNVKGWRMDLMGNWKQYDLTAKSTVEIIHDKSPIDANFSEVRVKSGTCAGYTFLVSHDQHLSPSIDRPNADGLVLTKDIKAYWWNDDDKSWSEEKNYLQSGSWIVAVNLEAPYGGGFVDIKVVEGHNAGFTFAVKKTDVNL